MVGFILPMGCGKSIFSKPPLDAEGQISLLEKRGLCIPDKIRAARYLQTIGYYRLMAYARPLQAVGDENHTFLPGSDFDTLLNLYIFDRKLRLIVLDAVERIEVAARTVINNHMTLQYGSHWYVDSSHFQGKKSKWDHAKFIDMVKKETGFERNDGPVFCKSYYAKYCEPELPPSWMVAEVLTIGAWSRIYSNLTKTTDKKYISDFFKIRNGLFGSWLHAVSHVRNICAHHSLLWNCVFTVKPKMHYEYFGIANDRFCAQSVVISKFLDGIAHDSEWQSRLLNHIRSCPLDYRVHMGFPEI